MKNQFSHLNKQQRRFFQNEFIKYQPEQIVEFEQQKVNEVQSWEWGFDRSTVDHPSNISQVLFQISHLSDSCAIHNVKNATNCRQHQFLICRSLGHMNCHIYGQNLWEEATWLIHSIIVCFVNGLDFNMQFDCTGLDSPGCLTYTILLVFGRSQHCGSW